MWDHTLEQLFYRGGTVMWPLLACSILGAAIVLERVAAFLWYSGSFAGLRSALESPVRDGRFEEARAVAAGRRGLTARVAETYLANINRPDTIRDDATSRAATEQLAKLEKRLNWLAVLGQLSPMLGLLGTVTGLITAFHQIELNQGQVQPADLAAGIWEALLTTVFGLVIALPVLAVYSFLEHRAANVAVQMQLIVSYLNDWREAAGASAPAPVAVEKPAAATKKSGHGEHKERVSTEPVAAAAN